MMKWSIAVLLGCAIANQAHGTLEPLDDTGAQSALRSQDANISSATNTTNSSAVNNQTNSSCWVAPPPECPAPPTGSGLIPASPCELEGDGCPNGYALDETSPLRTCWCRKCDDDSIRDRIRTSHCLQCPPGSSPNIEQTDCICESENEIYDSCINHCVSIVYGDVWGGGQYWSFRPSVNQCNKQVDRAYCSAIMLEIHGQHNQGPESGQLETLRAGLKNIRLYLLLSFSFEVVDFMLALSLPLAEMYRLLPNKLLTTARILQIVCEIATLIVCAWTIVKTSKSGEFSRILQDFTSASCVQDSLQSTLEEVNSGLRNLLHVSIGELVLSGFSIAYLSFRLYKNRLRQSPRASTIAGTGVHIEEQSQQLEGKEAETESGRHSDRLEANKDETSDTTHQENNENKRRGQTIDLQMLWEALTFLVCLALLSMAAFQFFSQFPGLNGPTDRIFVLHHQDWYTETDDEHSNQNTWCLRIGNHDSCVFKTLPPVPRYCSGWGNVDCKTLDSSIPPNAEMSSGQCQIPLWTMSRLIVGLSAVLIHLRWL